MDIFVQDFLTCEVLMTAKRYIKVLIVILQLLLVIIRNLQDRNKQTKPLLSGTRQNIFYPEFDGSHVLFYWVQCKIFEF